MVRLNASHVVAVSVFDGHTSEKSAEHARARLADILAQEPAIQNCTVRTYA